MKITIFSIGNTLLFRSEEDGKKEMVNLRINIGLNLIKEFTDKDFRITHIDYFNNYDYINNIIRKYEFLIDNSFKNFVLHSNQISSEPIKDISEFFSICKFIPFTLDSGFISLRIFSRASIFDSPCFA